MNKNICFLTMVSSAALVSSGYAAQVQTQRADDDGQTMVVTASPGRQLSPFYTPGAVSVSDGDDIRHAAPGINLSEGLSDIPGLQIQNRQNFAQDLQMSIRGFGARSAFGVRGIRMYVDGIPSTMPDGQGQLSNIDIASVDRIEVLRGPYSALYGNASGGVVNIESQTGSGAPTVENSNYYGSYATWRSGVKISGGMDSDGTDSDTPRRNAARITTGYAVSQNHFSTQGFRDNSSAHKNLVNANVKMNINDTDRFTLSLNSADIKADDPGGLTRQEWLADAQQAPRGGEYHTRKTVRQTQAGLRYQRTLTENDDVSIMAYAGTRDTVQYQSIPYFVQQRSDTHPGGVIDLARRYHGVDIRGTHKQDDFVIPFTLTAGLDYERLAEDRKGYENFVWQNGHYDLGTKGALRRDEKNTMWNLDPYLQASLQLTDALILDAGLRYSSVRFDSDDHYIRGNNGDDSGSVAYHQWLPVTSLQYHVSGDWNLYASAGRGFETPTINELSYRNDNKTGLNFDLKPATSVTTEAGSKWRTGSGLMSVALFQTKTDDEIVVASGSNGRTSYQNAGKTRRRGLEFSLDQTIADDWRLKTTWTWIDATYRSGSGKTNNDKTIQNGNRIPGIARNNLFVSFGWLPSEGWYAGTDVRYMSQIAANDANTEKAPAYTITALNTGYHWLHNGWAVDVFGRVDNLFDKQYVGSVIINESNGRYYEPAQSRNYGMGLSVSYAFE